MATPTYLVMSHRPGTEGVHTLDCQADIEAARVFYAIEYEKGHHPVDIFLYRDRNMVRIDPPRWSKPFEPVMDEGRSL